MTHDRAVIFSHQRQRLAARPPQFIDEVGLRRLSERKLIDVSNLERVVRSLEANDHHQSSCRPNGRVSAAAAHEGTGRRRLQPLVSWPAVIPSRHVSTWFDLHRPEQHAVNELLRQGRTLTRDADRTVAGFNMGDQ
jgi:hypothetical protein